MKAACNRPSRRMVHARSALVATLLGSAELQVLAQDVERGDARIETQPLRTTVDDQLDGRSGHGRILQTSSGGK
jgi:hypothetical protein